MNLPRWGEPADVSMSGCAIVRFAATIIADLKAQDQQPIIGGGFNYFWNN